VKNGSEKVNRIKWFFALMVIVLLAGCAPVEEVPAELFPAQVGQFLRISGPTIEPGTEVDMAVYQGPDGTTTLRINWVGEENVAQALSELPPTATDIGMDAALGQRQGVFFNYADEYHAAWGNGDWVFVISSTSEASRNGFLAGYGF
jgi:hypothetical protein